MSNVIGVCTHIDAVLYMSVHMCAAVYVTSSCDHILNLNVES